MGLRPASGETSYNLRQVFFYFYLLEDIGYDEPFLFLHCGENVPRELKQIISDNNLEPYIEGTANH